MKQVHFFIALAFSGITAFAQENEFCKNPDATLFTSVSTGGWVKFQEGTQLNSNNLFSLKKGSFGLQGNAEMKKQKIETDKIGFTHTWYSEYINGIPVLNGHFILHEKNSLLQSGNGKIYTSPIINTNIGISPKSAVGKALQLVHAAKYYWQDTAKENKLKRKTHDPHATYYPTTEMFFHYDEANRQVRLCYKTTIQTIDAGKSGIAYIYADNGVLFLWKPLESNTCDGTIVNTVWYGNWNIFCYTDDFTSGWDLEDDCNASTYKVYDYATSTNSIFNSNNNQWTTDRQRSAATALWSVRSTRDVFWNTYGRDGHNGDGGNIDMYFDYIFPGASPNNNASMHYDALGDDELNIGRGSDPVSILDDYSALDILAHEFTHGIVNYTCKLDYQRESGALNESFADVFGKFVENKVLGHNNWLMGWDRMTGQIHLPSRNLENPLQFDQPDRYLGKRWRDATGTCSPIGPGDPGNNDYCGVHYNSGVQNRMYFLLSIGGNGWTNDSSSFNTTAAGDNPYQWSVSAIGIDKAARIAYRVMTVYLSSNSNYFDSRNAWVHAAEDLYGACSFEAIQTGKAWYAVGIGPPAPSDSYICGIYGAGSPFNYTKAGLISISNNCTTTISTIGNQVSILSGTKVIIHPGFTSLNGSKFHAFIISDCSFANY